MPKVIIEFSLPDEKEEYQLTMKSSEYYSALHDIAMRIRETDKYNKDPISSEEFYNILNHYNINLDY